MDSPFTDQYTFRANYEKIIRDAWVAYCADMSAEHDYDYGADDLRELLEQVTNATVYLERKLGAGEEPGSALVKEYFSVQKAFYEKLKPIMGNGNTMLDYGNMVDLIGREFDIKNFRVAIAKAKRFLKMLSSSFGN